MKYFRKIDLMLAVFEKAMVVFLFFTLILLVVSNIITRNVFHTSFQEILEISPTLILWLALFGASLVLKDKRHIKIEIFLRFLSLRARFYANFASSIFGMMVMGILFYASLDFVRNEIELFGWQGGATLIFPWFFCISFFRFFIQLFNPYRSYTEST